MGKFDGILLCSDFDGTFATNGVPIEKNMEAIKYFRENGGLFALASGRDYEFLLPIFEGYDLGVPFICLNGAFIYDLDSKKIVSERFMTGMDRENTNRILRELDNVTYVGLFTREGVIFVDVEKGEKIPDETFDKLYKITFRVKDDGDRAKQVISEIMNEHCVERSSSNYIEVLQRESTKSPNTLALKALVGAHTLVCVGDYENDIEMIKSADIGYAVANACEEAKLVADRVTVSVNDGAIAKIIEDLEDL